MSRKPSPQKQATDLGLFVDNPERLGRDCARAIEAALKQKQLRFITGTGRLGGRTLLTLNSSQATSAKEKYDYKVIPFVVLNLRLYWLAVSLEFQYEQGKSQLISVSIFVFEGNATDTNKFPLIRAEWACLPSDIRSQHAQPHWHIYPSQLSRSQQNRQNFAPDPEVQIFSPESDSDEIEIQDFGQAETRVENKEEGTEWDRSEDFHFAMASRWHNGDSSNELLQIGQIPEWLSGCVGYTLEQFKYIYKSKKSL